MAEQKDGYVEYGPGEDWWPEDRMTTALRAVPKLPIRDFDDAYWKEIIRRGDEKLAAERLARKR